MSNRVPFPTRCRCLNIGSIHRAIVLIVMPECVVSRSSTHRVENNRRTRREGRLCCCSMKGTINISHLCKYGTFLGFKMIIFTILLTLIMGKHNHCYGYCHCHNNSFGSKQREKPREDILPFGLLLRSSIELLLTKVALAINVMGC